MLNLPKKVKRREAEVDGKVAQLLHKFHPRSFALEVKIASGKPLPHQLTALRQVTHGTFKPYKIPDMGRRNPFDYIVLKDADAILCVVDGKDVKCLVNEAYEIEFKI